MQRSSPLSLLHPVLRTVHQSSCSLPEVQHPSCLPSPVKDAQKKCYKMKIKWWKISSCTYVLIRGKNNISYGLKFSHPELSHFFWAEECDVTLGLLSQQGNNTHQNQTSGHRSLHHWRELWWHTNTQMTLYTKTRARSNNSFVRLITWSFILKSKKQKGWDCTSKWKSVYTLIQCVSRGGSRLRVFLWLVWEQSRLYRKSWITLRWYLLSLTFVSINSPSLTKDTGDTARTWHNLVVVTLYNYVFVTRILFFSLLVF